MGPRDADHCPSILEVDDIACHEDEIVNESGGGDQTIGIAGLSILVEAARLGEAARSGSRR